MRKNYNVAEIDDVVLNDYCSKEFLEGNFVTLLNNFWNETRVKFYLKEMIEENEVENLLKYYVNKPSEKDIYPSCKDIIEYQRNPYEFSDTIRDPNPTYDATVPTTPGVTPPTYDAGDINSLFELKQSPPREPSITNTGSSITHAEKEEMAKLDIEILKNILAQERSLKNEENKRIIRNIFFRMTDNLYMKTKRSTRIFFTICSR